MIFLVARFNARLDLMPPHKTIVDMDSSAEFRGGAILHGNDVVTARIKALLFIVPLLQGDQILHLATPLSRFDPSFLSFFLSSSPLPFLSNSFSLSLSPRWLQKWTTTSGRNHNHGGELALKRVSRANIWLDFERFFILFFFSFLFSLDLIVKKIEESATLSRSRERGKGWKEKMINLFEFSRF